MATELGAFLAGPHLVLRPGTNGQIVTEGAAAEQLAVKTHAAYTGSKFQTKTFALTTTDATVTAIASISVPSGSAVAVWAQVLGRQSASNDCSAFQAVGAAVNLSGTTTLEGTPNVVAVEGDASTNVTITINDTTDVINVNVTGIAAETWFWVAKLDFVELISAS